MRTSRFAAMLAAVVAVAGTAPSEAAPARATSHDPVPVSTGASWLAGQLTDGLVHNEQYDFDDYGLSIDVALALHASGTKATVAKQVKAQVAKNVASYVGYAPESYAGPTAKAAVLALLVGGDPRSFGGVDLVSALEADVSSAAPTAGRIADASAYGDYANVVGQAFAAQALGLAQSPKASSALGFLLEQQCSDGYFRVSFTTDKTAADQSCDGAPKAQRRPSTDATSTAVIALSTVKGARAKAARKRAVAWLEATQAKNGSFGSTASGKDANANSTGLAGWALGSAGADGAARKAAIWVRNLQVADNPCAGKLAGDIGAIAFDSDAYGTGQGFGIKKKTSDQWRRASAQALPVLRLAPKATAPFGASAPHTVQAGTTFRIDLSGVAPGQRVCVTGGGTSYEFESGLKATGHVSFAISGAGSRTYRVWAGTKHQDVTVRVTG